MNLALSLLRTAAADPSRPAVAVGADVVLDYGSLRERVARLAGGLRRRLGLAVGDRVAIAAANGPHYVEALYAVWHAGLTAVPINAKLHPREIAFILGDSGARLCLASAGLAAQVAALDAPPAAVERFLVLGDADYEGLMAAEAPAPEPRGPDDVAWLFYTSGTTGRPRG